MPIEFRLDKYFLNQKNFQEKCEKILDKAFKEALNSFEMSYEDYLGLYQQIMAKEQGYEVI